MTTHVRSNVYFSEIYYYNQKVWELEGRTYDLKASDSAQTSTQHKNYLVQSTHTP